MTVRRERRLIRSGMVCSLLGFAASLTWTPEYSGLAFVCVLWCFIAGSWMLLTRKDEA